MVNSQLSMVNRRPARWTGRAVAFCAMLAVGWLYRCDHPTDWDSWDYAAQAIMGHTSDLALGRWWFLAAMRGAYGVGALFGLGRAEAFVAMQVATALMTAGAVVAGMAWTRRLTGRPHAEPLFAAMVIAGPVVGLYTFSVMTEGMTLLFLSLALWAWEVARGAGPAAETAAAREGKMPSPRSPWRATHAVPRRPGLWAFAAGLAFGIAVDAREPVALVAAWPILSCLVDRRAGQWRLLALAGAGAVLTLAVGLAGAWAWYPWKGEAFLHIWGRQVDVSYFNGIRKGWEHMQGEKAQHPVSIPQNLYYLARFCVAGAPVAGLLAIPAVLWSAVRWRKGAWLAAALLPLAALMLLDHTLQVNTRHPLPLVWLLAPVAAAGLDGGLAAVLHGPRRRLAVAMAVVLAGDAGAMAFVAHYRILQEEYYDYVRGIARAGQALRRLPPDAAVVTGPGTAAAFHLNRIRETNFDVIASGWAWPPNVAEEIDTRMREGKPVYVYWDLDTWGRSARGSEWDRLREAVSKYDLVEAAPPYRRLAHRPPASAASGPATRAGPTGPPPLP
jgi:hypothetical protein